MSRSRGIIDIPPFMMMTTTADWSIDWRGQSAGEANDGSEQVVYNAFPRFTGSPSMILPEPMIGIWRAIRARAQGRVNAYRVPMIDPVSVRMAGRSWRNDLRAYETGKYQPVKPTVTCAFAVPAGAPSIVVDETLAHEPVRVGAYLSYNDWPFMVTGREGAGSAVTLSVTMLRTAIPAGGQIDLAASGLFLATSDTMGNPAYDVNRVARFDLDFIEWINR